MPELPEVEVTRRGIEPLSRAAASSVSTSVPRCCAGPCRRGRRAVARARGARRRASRQVPAVRGRRGLVHRPPRHDGHAARAARGRRAGRREARPHRLDLRRIRAAVPRSAPLRRGVWHPREAGDVHAHPLLASLGVEPFSPAFTGALLHARTRGRTVSVKQALLAGDMVVGVGNIYASESLFRAGIRPTTAAGRCRCRATSVWPTQCARRLPTRSSAAAAHCAISSAATAKAAISSSTASSTTVRASHAAYATRRSARSCRASGRPISVRPASVETFSTIR